MLDLETVCPLHVLLAGDVRQGCSLSPLLYLIYDEAMLREATHNMEAGISVGGRIINTNMQTTRQWWITVRKGYSMDNLNKVIREIGMKINVLVALLHSNG